MNQSREDPSPVISQLSLEIETSCSVDMESCSDSQVRVFLFFFFLPTKLHQHYQNITEFPIEL
jgi:hypothetical protein